LRNTRYLAGWEFIATDPSYSVPYLMTHGVDEEGFRFFKSIQKAIEIRYRHDKTCDIYTHCEGEESECIYQKIALPIDIWPNHSVFFLKESENGRHRIGGKRPSALRLPHLETMKTPFNYLGTIDGNDPFFDWLSIPEFHIIWPINEYNSGIYLDYSDPMAPKVLNPETFSNAWHDPTIADPPDPDVLERRYEAKAVTENELDLESNATLLCGVPMWLQAPEIPICPKSSEIMRFVCMFNSSENGFSFGDFGHLYLFYEPRSKIAHLNIQF
jgi:hypothetical protein